MQDVFLVCARADATFTVKGSKFDRVCYRCGQAVMIAPSGIERLEKEPNIQILCVICAINLMTVKTPNEIEVAPNVEDELRYGVIPNMHRYRN